jgi:hypothetical protein
MGTLMVACAHRPVLETTFGAKNGLALLKPHDSHKGLGFLMALSVESFND